MVHLISWQNINLATKKISMDNILKIPQAILNVLSVNLYRIPLHENLKFFTVYFIFRFFFSRTEYQIKQMINFSLYSRLS